MPTYSYECPNCHAVIDEQRTIDDRLRRPKCTRCKKLMSKVYVGTQHLTPDFTPYLAAGHERGKLIKTRAQHRDYLRKYGYEEVGNDASMAPPADNPDRDAARRREYNEALADMGRALPHVRDEY